MSGADGAASLRGRTIVLTGASSGIGAVAARELATRGATIAVVGRNPERTRAVADSIGAPHFLADYDRLADVRALASALLERFPRIHVLANNAGGLVSRRGLSADGHDRTLQHNHLAPFLLTRLLLPRMLETAAAARADNDDVTVRVLGTASVASRFGAVRLDDLQWRKRAWLGGWRAYGTAKLATILFTKELARRTADAGVEAYSFHPGFVRTRFGGRSAAMAAVKLLTGGSYGISEEAGAVPLVQLASVPRVGAASGTYFDTLTPNGATHPQAEDAWLARSLWAATEALVDR